MITEVKKEKIFPHQICAYTLSSATSIFWSKSFFFSKSDNAPRNIPPEKYEDAEVRPYFDYQESWSWVIFSKTSWTSFMRYYFSCQNTLYRLFWRKSLHQPIPLTYQEILWFLFFHVSFFWSFLKIKSGFCFLYKFLLFLSFSLVLIL